jgi:hypothetical protein
MKTILAAVFFCLFAISAAADSAKPIHVIQFSDYQEGSESKSGVTH